MTDLLDRYGEQFMLITALILFILMLLVLAIAFVSRWRLRKKEAYRVIKSEQLSELIIRYVSGEIEVTDIEKKLENRTDYILLLELVTRLEQSLDGVEVLRLQKLMDIKNNRDHFNKWFDSDDPIQKARACLYFAKKANIPADKLPDLVSLSAREEPMLSYAATSALMVHGSMKDKAESINNVLVNSRISKMAVSDLLVQMTKHGNEYHEEEAFLLMSLASDKTIPRERIAILIQVLDEFEYLHSIDFLWNFYQKLDLESAHPEVLAALLHVLSKFGWEEILDDVHQYFAVCDKPELREEAARCMGFFRKKVSIPILEWLLNDPDYMVRYEAARALSQYKHLDFRNLNPPGLSEKEWHDLSGEVLAESEVKY